MKKIPLKAESKLVIKGIEGFFIKKVTKFGNSAKVDCPKSYIGRTVYLVIVPPDHDPTQLEIKKQPGPEEPKKE